MCRRRPPSRLPACGTGSEDLGVATRKQDERGAAMTEYALLVLVVALVALLAVEALGLSVLDLFDPVPLPPP